MRCVPGSRSPWAPARATIRIEFGSVDDLERIVGVIARGLQTELSIGDGLTGEMAGAAKSGR
jgi:hypothetical protein